MIIILPIVQYLITTLLSLFLTLTLHNYEVWHIKQFTKTATYSIYKTWSIKSTQNGGGYVKSYSLTQSITLKRFTQYLTVIIFPLQNTIFNCFQHKRKTFFVTWPGNKREVLPTVILLLLCYCVTIINRQYETHNNDQKDICLIKGQCRMIYDMIQLTKLG